MLVQPSVVQSSTVPQFWVEDPSGKGSGASYHVTKLSPGDMLSYSGGWNRMGKKDDTFETVAACSTLRYHSPIGVSKSGGVLSDIRPGSSSNSPPSFQSITSVATDYLGLFPTAHDSADGTLWVTDGFTKRQQSPIEIKLTSFGNDLTCPPLVEIAAPDGAAKAVAVLNGKVVAVGVDAAGLGYSVAPSIEFTAFGKGSGAKATAHIRGSLTSITVDAEGTKYNTRPKVRLTNHVCPSGDIGEATASLASGYVVSASVTGSGEGYEVPPSAFAASQQFSTTIKGFVKSVSVTDGGSYLSCPEVVIGGAAAVAFLEPHKAESGRYAVSMVEVTSGGSAYSTPPTVTFSGGGEDATQATGVSVLNAGVDTIFTTGIAASDLSEVPIIRFLNGGATASCVCEFGVGPVTVTKEGLYWSSPDVEFASKGIVSSIALTNAGKGYTSAPDVLVVGSCNENATASCTISGKITSLTINPISGGGFGYKSKYPPFVKFSGGLDPTYGVSATATATCGGGIITGISLTSAGSGYRSTPSVSFVSPMTATAIAEINKDGEIIAAKIINRGAYYAAAPEVVVEGVGSGGKISAVMANGSVSKLTIDDKGKGYTFAPSLAFTYDQSGADAVASCSLEYTVKSVGVISSGAGFSTAAPPKVLFVGGGGTGAAATATVTKSGSGAIATSKINGSVVYVEVTSQGSGYEFSPAVTAVPSKIDAPISSVAELQSRILGKVTTITLSSPGTGYTDGKNGTCQPLSRPVAFLNGVGYQYRDPITIPYEYLQTGFGQYRDFGMAEVTFTVGTDGSLSGEWVGTSTATGSTSTLDPVAATPSSTSLLPALNPTFGTPAGTPDGFTVQITNYDSNYTWGASESHGRWASVGATGLVAVSGAAANMSLTATVTTTRSGYNGGTAQVSATSLMGGGVDDFYVQRPAVVFVDALGVQAPTLMDSSSVGVDHIGSAGSGSIKPTPSVDTVYSGPLVQTPPTSRIAISAASIAENNAAGDPVGEFSTDTDDPGNTFTYLLVGGVGSQDNASFTIDSGQLLAALSFSYGLKRSYSIRVRSTDKNGLQTENAFTISITGVNSGGTRRLAVAPTIVFPDECKTVATATIEGSIDSEDWEVKLANTGSGYFSGGPCRQILRGFVSKCVTDPPTATTTIDAVTGRVLTVSMTSQGGGWPLFSSLACYLSGGGGTGAKATVAVSSEGIISVALVSPGGGYTTAPIVTIIGGLPESEDWVTNFRIEVNGALAAVQYVPTTAVLLFRTQEQTARTVETAMIGMVNVDSSAFGYWSFFPYVRTRYAGGLHRFYRNGRVISLEIAAPEFINSTAFPNYDIRGDGGHPDGFSRKSQTDPAITITVASGTAPTATAKSVRWLPQQSGGVAIRDVSEETFD